MKLYVVGVGDGDRGGVLHALEEAGFAMRSECYRYGDFSFLYINRIVDSVVSSTWCRIRELNNEAIELRPSDFLDGKAMKLDGAAKTRRIVPSRKRYMVLAGEDRREELLDALEAAGFSLSFRTRDVIGPCIISINKIGLGVISSASYAECGGDGKCIVIQQSDILNGNALKLDGSKK